MTSVISESCRLYAGKCQSTSRKITARTYMQPLLLLPLLLLPCCCPCCCCCCYPALLGYGWCVAAAPNTSTIATAVTTLATNAVLTWRDIISHCLELMHCQRQKHLQRQLVCYAFASARLLYIYIYIYIYIYFFFFFFFFFFYFPSVLRSRRF